MKKHRLKKIILIIIIIALLVLIYILYNKFYLNDDLSNNLLDTLTKTEETLNENNNEDKTSSNKDELFVVEIKGCVYYPGVYTFNKDQVIVNDVVEMAGGLTRRADISSINLASIVENHSYIFIGSIESKSYILKEDEKIALININTATKEKLLELPGIGESKAQAIINYRIENGYFTKIEDIKNVSGIGENLFNQIKSYITI